MATEVENVSVSVSNLPLKTGWLRERRASIRARGNVPIVFAPIKIEGEPLSVTIIRERRGDFDN